MVDFVVLVKMLYICYNGDELVILLLVMFYLNYFIVFIRIIIGRI